ncbi:MAG: response regulator [Saprospiraceae bacterium]|nr:response regulator [Saprospiraceae bacterium]
MPRILLLICIAVPGWLFAQTARYNFLRFDTKQGLSHNQVNCFLKDKNGFVWIGTQAGLNRFDGSAFKVFRNRRADSTSLANDAVYNLMEDPLGNIWVSDRQQFCVFEPQTERFYADADAWARKFGLPNARITKFLNARNGDCWINHTELGLCRYNPQTGRLLRLSQAQPDSSTLRLEQIADFQEDAQGRLWVIHRNGILECLDPLSQKVCFRSFQLRHLYPEEPANFRMFIDRDDDIWLFSEDIKGGQFFDSRSRQFQAFGTNTAAFRLSNDLVRAIAQDDAGLIWVATDHGGITLLDKPARQARYLVHDPDNDNSISQNSTIALYKSADGAMWVGTHKKGFNLFHPSIFQFPLYRHQPSDPNSLPVDDINDFAEDQHGNLWIGTNGGGLVYFDRKNNRFTRYRHQPGNAASLSNDVIVCLFIDHEQQLWIGTYFGGLNRFDGKTFTHFTHQPNDPNSLSDDRVWEIFEDAQQHLWVGTLRGGLNLFDRKQQHFRRYRSQDANSIRAEYISTLAEDREGNLWIGTDRGVDVLEWRSGNFMHYETASHGLSNNLVTSILEDGSGHIWVATMHGLNLFDRKQQRFQSFGKAEGLPDDAVVSLVEDDQYGLWMGTPNGLANLQVTAWAGERVKDFVVRSYNELDGMQGRQFNEDAACKTRSGELVFGGANGFNIIHPPRIDPDPGNVKVLLTDFQIFNRSVRPQERLDGNMVLEKSITETQHITLEHSQNVFSIEFTALNFFHPAKKNYLYTLEGFNKEWFSADNNSRKVTYTNLDPGKYVFRVRALNEGGQWIEGARLEIRVLPPFWRSTTAWCLYVLLVAGALVLARWLILDRERMRFHHEQERREAQRTHELDLLKIKFLTNISHEFRTPLSLILTPLERMLGAAKGTETEDRLNLVYRNAKRLLHLVNQLLDFKKLEVEETVFMPEQGDIVPFVREISESFAELSDKKHIHFSFRSEIDTLQMVFDPDKLSRVMLNLLSNAFKFTPENGSVSVLLQRLPAASVVEPELLEIRVSDSGVGIPAAAQPRIFDRFFQHQVPESMVNQGSGIGLSITREFIRLHEGSIQVQSEEGKGSTFIVRLPVRLARASAALEEPVAALPLSDIPPGEAAQTPAPGGTAAKPKVLVVEDNEDLRAYLRDAFSAQYEVLEAANGKAGWSLVLEQMPDLVVSDVVMPGIDGMELCHLIKHDDRTAQIPVILLTARSAEEEKLQGYETGADAYVTKPFRLDLLTVRVQNLIRQKDQREAARHFVSVQPQEIAITSLDEQLVARAVGIVEQNISNAEFSVEELSHALAMSRMYLYKKLLAITGKTPIEFIRVIRLKRAAQLLEKSQLTVAEVAYKVGFNNPKYFSRYFRDEYGLLPAAYQKRFKSKQ